MKPKEQNKSTSSTTTIHSAQGAQTLASCRALPFSLTHARTRSHTLTPTCAHTHMHTHALARASPPPLSQTAALALGRLANHSDELAAAVVHDDILPQLVYSLAEQNRSDEHPDALPFPRHTRTRIRTHTHTHTRRNTATHTHTQTHSHIHTQTHFAVAHHVPRQKCSLVITISSHACLGSTALPVLKILQEGGSLCAANRSKTQPRACCRESHSPSQWWPTCWFISLFILSAYTHTFQYQHMHLCRRLLTAGL